MKTLKISAIATIITIIIISLCSVACAEIYTADAVVMGKQVVSSDTWEITAQMKDGNQFSWYDEDETIRIGDLFVLTMYNDEVIDVIRVDSLTPQETAHWFR